MTVTMTVTMMMTTTMAMTMIMMTGLPPSFTISILANDDGPSLIMMMATMMTAMTMMIWMKVFQNSMMMTVTRR